LPLLSRSLYPFAVIVVSGSTDSTTPMISGPDGTSNDITSKSGSAVLVFDAREAKKFSNENACVLGGFRQKKLKLILDQS
jgi:hypothetical protein